MHCDDTGGGIDYDAEEYDVTFPIGFTNASLDISINDDGLLENDETFRVSIHSVTNNHSIGIPGEAIVTILDSTGKHFLCCCVYAHAGTYVLMYVFICTYMHYVHAYICCYMCMYIQLNVFSYIDMIFLV